jgi:hypothetical protein
MQESQGAKEIDSNRPFLEASNLSLQAFAQIVYLWAHKVPVSTACEMLELSLPTLVQWYSFLRDACSNYFERHDYTIGGVGHQAEIDESVISRRKYQQGRLVRERWVFGGIDVETKLGFLIFVEDRSADTLLPLIQRFVAPGSTIASDGWAAYNGISSIHVLPPYIHNVVNHSDNFVDPESGATTNHVERMWCDAKRRLKSMNGTTDDMLPGHLDEFMWRQSRGKTGTEASNSILQTIAEWYHAVV